jgi:2-C-methyl-D-erythritol 4-phosphate cytidylyltransferase
MKKYLILMAAGSGTRINENTPKQFIEVSGIPIIAHTYKQFKNSKT